VAPDRGTVAIYGSGESLSKMPSMRIASNQDIATFATGAIAVAQAVAMVAVPEVGIPIVLCAAVTELGGLTLMGVGVKGMLSDADAVGTLTIAPVNIVSEAGKVTIDEVTIVGKVPDAPNPSDIVNDVPIDAQGLPDSPPGGDGDEGDTGGGGDAGGGGG
jgi:hypothetical protein